MSFCMNPIEESGSGSRCRFTHSFGLRSRREEAQIVGIRLQSDRFASLTPALMTQWRKEASSAGGTSGFEQTNY
jgi:hypothetical protein